MKKSSILVVEDEMIVAEDLKHRLTAMGYDVPEPACSSEEAICRTDAWTPDLILMDIVLEGSGMDGIETARAILAKAEVPIIFVTAFADDVTLDRAKTADPFAYILKPFNERESVFRHRTGPAPAPQRVGDPETGRDPLCHQFFGRGIPAPARRVAQGS